MRSTPLALLLTMALAVSLVVPAAAGTGEEVKLVARSNRADLVSGGDVLLEAVLPSGADTDGMTVTADGRDVSGAFHATPDGRVLGLVDGLPVGTTTVTLTLADGRGATLPVTNHPIGGPVFAGRQVTPWPCATEEHGLGPARDEQCNADPVLEFFYVADDDDQAFQPYDPANPPGEDDVATTTTDEGETVPFIVRRERGVIDRGLYDIAVLWDPGQPWDRDAPQRGWNGKLHWPFGGSCQPYHGQVAPGQRPDVGGAPGVLDDPSVLGRGFAVATSALSVLGNNCNTVVSAEALMMIKEHIVETYGDIRYTFGIGGSGGSIQQIQIAGAYPGLLDGIIPNSTFADITTTATENVDCRLLVRYFTRTSPHLWPPAQQSLVMGHGTPSTCHAWISVYGFPAMLAKPDLGCRVPLLTYQENDVWGVQGLESEPEWVYHSEDNPDGVRCTVWDYAEPVFGTSAETGFANRTFDNVGVQYGLVALRAGEILPEQFLDLNANIGGLGPDYGFTAERSVAEEEGVRRAYASGQATVGNHLDRVPIIDGSFTPPHGDIHTAFHAFSLHERLRAANGTADNHVIRQGGGGPPAFDLMDQWLAAVEADDRDIGLDEKVIANKPEEAQPSGDYLGTDPRIDAGAPLADDVLKCRLRPLAREDYADLPVPFTDQDWERLEAIFPDGVCDWTRPSVGFTETVPWATYAGGDGPIPLGPPPTSTPFEAPPTPSETGPRVVERFAGPGRVDTAVAISAATLETAETVVVASSETFADALAGGPLAAELGAPLLLTGRAAVPAVVLREIDRLGATAAVVLGGRAAISDQAVADLEAEGLATRRVAGADRYATAAAIAGEMATRTGDDRGALLASGEDFPDAVAAAALGAVAGRPVLLTAADGLPSVTADALEGLEGDEVLVLGGVNAVGEAAVAAAARVAGSVRRVAGPDRTHTAVAAAGEALAAGAAPSTVWLATGESFADALAAAPAVARDGGVLLLVTGEDPVGQPAVEWIDDRAGQVARVRVAGGPLAVAPALEDAVRQSH